MSAGLGQRLEGVLGADRVRAHEPLPVEGAKLAWTLRPGDGEALASALRVLGEEGAGALVRGGGTRLEQANAPCTASVLLETGGLEAPPEVDAEEGVARFAGATPLAVAHGALGGSGWELPLEGPAGATVGGTLASGAPGLRGGPPRDCVLGMDVCLGSGERVKFGGRVVKNVTGYDLAKLFVGSCGSLGVIERAWLRLRPVPGCTRAFRLPMPWDEGGFREAIAHARRATVRAALAFRPEGELAPERTGGGGTAPEPAEGADRVLHVELAGDEPGVAADARALLEAGASELPDPAAADGPAGLREGGPFRVRLAFLPSRLPDVLLPLEASGAATLVDLVHGTCWARFPLASAADERRLGALWQAVRAAARAGGGPFLVERAPLSARRGREVFGEPGASTPLQQTIKQQYDPGRVLNPGRFVGGA